MVRKLSSGQTVAAIKQLRKIATLKKAVSTRQKLLLTMLGLAGGTAGLSASNKDSIGDYWGNKMQGEMSDDDAMKRDYGITDEELASGMDTSDFDAMPDYGSKEDISNNLNAEAAQIGDSKYDNNADAELQKLLGSGVADSLKGSPLWGGDDGEAAKNYDYSNDDMAGLFDLEGATPDNEMSDEDIMKRDYGITDEELSSGMGTSDLDAIPDYKKDEDLQSIIAGGAGGDPQVSEEEDIRALLDQNDDLELGSSQSVPMDLSRPADIPQNLERPPADVPVYSDDMQGLFDMVDNPPEDMQTNLEFCQVQEMLRAV